MFRAAVLEDVNEARSPASSPSKITFAQFCHLWMSGQAGLGQAAGGQQAGGAARRNWLAEECLALPPPTPRPGGASQKWLGVCASRRRCPLRGGEGV
ncbi:hypothetical protein GN956_G15410 [Arapaima gigas]